jgi:ubiquinone biosynthesis protein UbiJ
VSHERIDEIEEGLSRWVGDIAAHQVGRVLRGIAGFGRRTEQTIAADISEYLQEESRDLVTRTELEEFLAAVDEVREAADRLGARIDSLAQKDRA